MRIQLLHLPAPEDEFPFALVVDQCTEPAMRDLERLRKEDVGARCVLVFADTVEVL